MNANYFMDTNVLLYRYAKQDEQKRCIAANLLESQQVVVSVQVLNEFCNVTRRRFPESYVYIEDTLKQILGWVTVISLIVEDTNSAVHISKRYGFSFYDSMILAVAQRIGCPIVLSEDMQHNMVLDSGLRIINPFVLV